MSYPSLRRRRGPTKEVQESIRRWSERLPQKSDEVQEQSSQTKDPSPESAGVNSTVTT
ncbi:MAG: hypothetical protein P1V97_11390 [Planctomycetota bacterium]|nr:hypothetical protein [Planctomycetota bacterium]